MRAGKIIRQLRKKDGYVLLEDESAVSEAYRNHFVPPKDKNETSISCHTAAKVFGDGHVHLIAFVYLPQRQQGWSWGDGREPVIVRLRLENVNAKTMPLDTLIGVTVKELTKRMKDGKSVDAVFDEVEQNRASQQAYVPVRGARIRSAGLGLTAPAGRVARLG
jgi:hypothetical protein